MPEYVWNIGFAISLVFTSSFCILIAKRVFKSGVEHFSSRILILSGIINTCLCSLLFLSQGIYEFIRILTSDSIRYSQLLLPLFFIVVPVRILWNYFSIPKKPVNQYDLKPCATDKVNAEIAAICKTMVIHSPAIMYSDSIELPFVFGRRSNRAILAIPKRWLNNDSSHRHIQLLHELSHIRNHDVGFLAWSNACLRDFRLLFILLPILVVYSFSIGYSYTISSVSLYLACSLILFTMLRYIIRKREMLADMTAAMLVESGKIKDVITSQEMFIATSDINSRQNANLKFADNIHRWLSDKAMFSKKSKPWKALFGIFNFFYLFHPSVQNRVTKINSQKTNSQQPNSSFAESFWAGVSIGLLSVIIGLASYWFAIYIQKPPENINLVRLPFDVYGMASMIPPGFLAIFLALPIWSSLKRPTLDRRLFLSLLARYAVALAGACLTCPLILTAGVVKQDILLLFVICALWNTFITIFSYGISAVIIPLWVTIRYLQSSHIAELRKVICAFSLFIIAIFGLIFFGCSLINDDMGFCGSNVIFSAIAGGALASLAARGSRFSETEQYTILSTPFMVFLFEGKWYKISAYGMCSFYLTGLLFIFTPLIYLAVEITFGILFHDIDSTLGIIIAVAASCSIMVLLERKDFKRISERKKSKINILCYCLKLLSNPINTNNFKKINEVVNSYDLKKKVNKTRNLNLTMHDAYEVTSLVLDNADQSKTLAHVSKWVLKCQKESGFGLWPTSSPRLYSTYQALSILKDVNLIDKCNADRHISWIKTLQQPDGCFKGPWSKRHAWQDTFYAVKSLNLLGAALDNNKTLLCKNWCQNMLIKKGIEKGRIDIIYYCFGTLTSLSNLDDEITKIVSDRISSKIEESLLTNISLDYEDVNYTIMTYDLLDGHLNISPESINLLIDRIQTALNAELDDIRI